MPDPTDRDLGDDLEPELHAGEAHGSERLDEIEIEPGRLPGGGLPERRDRILPMVLAGLAVLGSVLLSVMFFLFRTPAPRATATPAPGAVAPGGPAPAVASSPAAPLPPLDASDALARTLASALSSHPDFTRWLARNNLVRTLAAVVTNVADGESPRPHLEFLAPAARFRVRRVPRLLVADPAGYEGYDAFGDAVASVDARAAASAYHAVEPLFDEAHRELGHPEGRFRDSLDRAVAALLAVPVLREDAPLAAHATLFRWTDPAVEGLTPAQKQLLRTGPRNVRLVQEKLREIRATLAAPAPGSP